MSVDSSFGYYERAQSARLDAVEPVTSWRAFLARNNLQHLIDVAGQMRVNWASFGAADEKISVAAGALGVFRFVFPWQQINAYFPYSLDVRIAAITAGGTATLGAILYSGLLDPSAPSAARQVWANVGNSVTTTTGAWIIDDKVEQSDMSALLTLPSGAITESSYEPATGTNSPAVMHRATLLVTLQADASNAAGFCAAQVREYVEGLS